MAGLKEAKSGMAIGLDWNGKETVLAVGGKPAGSPIPGEDFYAAVLRVWLGETPADPGLKKGMLGG